MIPLSYNVRSILRRRFSAFATAAGLGLVVFVFAAVLMLAPCSSAVAQKNEGLGVVAPIQKDQSDQAPFPAPRKIEAPAPVRVNTISPSAPTPVCRSHIARATAGSESLRSAAAAT